MKSIETYLEKLSLLPAKLTNFVQIPYEPDHKPILEDSKIFGDWLEGDYEAPPKVWNLSIKKQYRSRLALSWWESREK